MSDTFSASPLPPCPTCGADGRPDARYCHRCGAPSPIVTPAVVHSTEGPEPPSTCGQCGAALRGDARFCVACGAVIPVAAAPVAATPVAAVSVPAAPVPAAPVAPAAVIGPTQTPHRQHPTAWAPTHRIGSPGQPLWAEPNADGQPTGKLAAGLEIEVIRVWGAWAQIRLENDWAGWVDNRRLVPC